MKGQLKKGAVLSYINIVISIVSGFIISPLLIKGMGNSEYGAYQMTAALIGYMSILDFGLHNAVTRYVARYQAQKDKKGQENFIAVSLIIFSLLAVVILILAGILYVNIDSIYSSSATAAERELIKKLLIVLAVNLAVSMPGAVFSSVVIAYEHFFYSKICVTIKMIVRFVLLIAIGFWHYSAMILVLLDFTLNVLLILSQMIYCFTVLKVTVRLHNMSWTFLKAIFSFSLFVFIASITEQINWKADTTILGILSGTAAVTYYSIAGNLISYYRNFSGAISGIFLPKATKMVVTGHSNAELTDLMIRIGRIQLMIIGLILAGFTVLGKEFIVLWVGEEFSGAYLWFMIMALPLVVPMTQSIGINILEAKIMHRFRAIVYFFIALGNIILTAILVKYIGIVGAPIGTGISMFIGNNIIINWYYSKKVHLQIFRFFKETYGRILPIQLIVCALCFFANQMVTTEYSWIWFILKAAFITVVYAAAIYLFGMNKEEKAELNIIGRLRK